MTTIINGKEIDIKGKIYISPEGYSSFGFRFDEKKNKWSIANLETEQITDSFIDEVVYSKVSLETWTSNYVVVRIDGKYYLCDNNGTCLFESAKPYIICRNAFVSGSGEYESLINKNLEIIQSTPENQFIIEEIEGIKFAFYKCVNEEDRKYKKYLINSLGEKVLPNGDEENYERMIYDNLPNWSFEREKGYLVFLLNNDLDIIIKGTSVMLVGMKSKTYYIRPINGKCYEMYYSIYFEAEVKKIRKYSEFEIVEYNRKTYFFKANGKVEEIDALISEPRETEFSIVYRQGSYVIERDLKGEVIAEEKITPKEVYLQSLLEALVAKR